jgi:hypothetical protein
MATENIRVATQVELAARAERGATLGQLLDHLNTRKRELRGGRFSDEQDDELQLYCWMVYERRSRGVLWGEPKEWRFLEQDIGG